MNKVKQVLSILIFTIISTVDAQNQENMLPYHEIPNYPENYTAGAVVARMIDGLGFRFYWATDNLTEADLTFQPSEGTRTTHQTMAHVFGLSNTIVNAALHKTNESVNTDDLDYNTLRLQTLINLKTAADILRDTDDLSKHNLMFSNREMPFWFNINGPIADAIWHCGQIASFRRITGNPINSKISFFTGTVRD